MKGAVFTNFQEMIEEQFGMECWETLLEKCNLPSGGIYTSSETYDDEEILSLVVALSEHSSIPVPDLVEAFGRYLYDGLAHSLPPSMMDFPDLWSLLEAVDSVIHVEVNKLYPDASTPSILVTEKRDNGVTLYYQSPRKLCLLAIGLIHKAAESFDTPITIKHTCCMNEGADHCSLVIERS
ncbi:heme NO-binding domain-containing protein [Marinomonas posidonica]|uniref:Heme NO binding domain protein n=1 Tax=Marinomonas posidonica (strain CECT 7376 / NCIMB 14433 / IVIA-Po-181) TaxID=491952 RepID=F6CZX7_MARPP|nr:heme NO-binding domain-containing protein [Marinomonas posidonica]AEF54717.1 Heme NO binding domain protein [Marinomonas posidonica IVIA-Po-181]